MEVDIDGTLVNVKLSLKKLINFKEFLFINFIFFTIIGLFTFLYKKCQQI